MFNQDDLTDVVDIIFEYTTPPSIEVIAGELGITKIKTVSILNKLASNGIISFVDGEIKALVDYPNAILLAESICD